MKQIIFFLLFTASLSAQELTNDSTYINWESGAWYRVTILQYDNGASDIFKRIIGDTSALFNSAVDGIRTRTSALANDVSFVSNYGKQVKSLLRESDEIALKAGKNPADSIEAKDTEPFLASGWQIRFNGVNTPITFNKTAAGKLRYQYTTTTNRQTDLMGAVIRLRDFPTSGTTTDFYRFPNGKRWVNLDRSYQLIPPGGSAANR